MKHKKLIHTLIVVFSVIFVVALFCGLYGYFRANPLSLSFGTQEEETIPYVEDTSNDLALASIVACNYNSLKRIDVKTVIAGDSEDTYIITATVKWTTGKSKDVEFNITINDSGFTVDSKDEDLKTGFSEDVTVLTRAGDKTVVNALSE
jgi:hypothetical protein